jgi:hypothetical protein
MYVRELITEIETEHARKLELRLLDKIRKDRAQARRDMKVTMKAQMKDLGLDPAIMFDALERQSLEDDQFVEDSKTHLTLVWEAHFTQAKKEAKRRAKGESAEARDELEEEEAEAQRLREEAEAEAEENGEGGGEQEGKSPDGDTQKKDANTDFSDVDEESEEEEEPHHKKKKEPKPERKKRAVNKSKEIL